MAAKNIKIHIAGCDGILNKSTLASSIQTDAYVKLYDEDGKEALITHAVFDSIHPRWTLKTASVVLPITNMGSLTAQVWHAANPDEFLGQVLIPGEKLLGEQEKGKLTFPLAARVKETDEKIKKLSKVQKLGTLVIQYKQEQAGDGKKVVDEPDAPGQDVDTGHSIMVDTCRGLLNRDQGGAGGELSDPYIIVRDNKGSKLLRTKTVESSLAPVFQETIFLPRPDKLKAEEKNLKFEVWNENPRPQLDNFLGTAIVDIEAKLPLDNRAHAFALSCRPDEKDVVILSKKDSLGTILLKRTLSGVPLEAPATTDADAFPSIPKPTMMQPSLLQSQRSAHLPEGRKCMCPQHADTGRSSPEKRLIETQYRYKPSQFVDHEATIQEKEVVLSENSTVVPVYFTTMDGQHFLTELDLYEPLSTVGEEIEKNFNLCPASQRLYYNGDIIQKETESLGSAGALLLKGEPYVKIMVRAAKGSILALNCVLPNRRQIPISIEEDTPFAEVKFMLGEVLRKIDPEDLRLFYQGTNLADSGTPDFYHMKNGARIDVVKKPLILEQEGVEKPWDNDWEPSRPWTAERIEAEREEKEMVKEERGWRPSRDNGEPEYDEYGNEIIKKGRKKPSWNQAEKPTVQTWKRKPRGEQNTIQSITPSQAAVKKIRAQSVNARNQRQQQSGQGDYRDWGPYKKPPLSQKGGGKFSYPEKDWTNAPRHTVENRPKSFYELEKMDIGKDYSFDAMLPFGSADPQDQQILQLKGMVDYLNTQMGNKMNKLKGGWEAGNNNNAAQHKVKELEHQCQEQEKHYEEALERIQELEATVERYQHILNRMTGASGGW